VIPRGLVLAAALALVVPPAAQDAPRWPDTFTARVEALALIQTLNAEILASRSATATLETWCGDHHLADPARIVADRDRQTIVRPTPEQLRRLEVTNAADVNYRHVRLRCGSRVLAEADNWYVPARLSAEMNRVLDSTDAPFGRVVAPLAPYRQTISVTLLWSPLPAGWDRGTPMPPDAAGRPLEIPAALFEHRAVLFTKEHHPFSEVAEIYRRDVLSFPPPRT
jgi:chorismate-pyruvate lyase